MFLRFFAACARSIALAFVVALCTCLLPSLAHVFALFCGMCKIHCTCVRRGSVYVSAAFACPCFCAFLRHVQDPLHLRSSWLCVRVCCLRLPMFLRFFAACARSIALAFVV